MPYKEIIYEKKPLTSVSEKNVSLWDNYIVINYKVLKKTQNVISVQIMFK